MQIKSLAVMALMAAAGSSFAATGSASFVSNAADFDEPAVIAPGAFTDTITFNSLATGTYDFELDFSGQSMHVDTLTLNGIAADEIINTTTSKGAKYSFGNLDSTSHTPFVLTIGGTAFKTKFAPSYSGTLSVTAAVPEPETYALMLAGLGAVGFVARRRKTNKV